ncbi:MAG TPA: tryptophanase [candidate division WOR-3 bacterium]|uniref:Tryptophanase n=1 Tax=candidate division WOR-3 bacterium TaxID=2052148 RepID=A0A7V0XEN8_UNCW3|nr:tryptophanase [candidate division WOR-3 bacterium]
MRFTLENWAEAFASLPVRPRPYRNAAVSLRGHGVDEQAERARVLVEVGLNVFRFPAALIPGCDLLTDSGTTTMTMPQWAALLLGDESYGSNEGYFELKRQVVETFGPAWENRDRNFESVFIFHQGRAAEHGLFSCLGRMLDARARVRGDGRPWFVIPSNGHFDTTQANVEANGFEARNLFSPEQRAKDASAPFRGNMDTGALHALLADPATRERVPLVYLTITNNTGGGQPVSLENIRQVSELCRAWEVPLLFDACRFAENAWFIREREPGREGRGIAETVREMFEFCDGFHISLKKDGLANIGGCLCVCEDGLLVKRFPGIREALTMHQVLVEGHPTYGGLAGRDLKAIAEGLRTAVRQEYLDWRIGQVGRFGAAVDEACGADVTVKPFGGHAVYIDLDRFFAGTGLGDGDFPGISLTALLLVAGHRLCELGVYAFGKEVNGREVGPEPRVNNVRAAIPRLCYEDEDLRACAGAIGLLYRERERVPGVEVTYGKDRPMRHFISRFRFRDGTIETRRRAENGAGRARTGA